MATPGPAIAGGAVAGKVSPVERREAGKRKLVTTPLPARLCRQAIADTEQKFKIPRGLLGAISLVETGRRDPAGGLMPWAWTIYAKGKGRYFPSKAAAKAEVQKLQAQKVRNIDIGCMQINLQYHPKAFPDLDTALDPLANARYAAGLLYDLYKKNRSWSVAMGHYHSSTRSRNGPYRQRVLKRWSLERQRVFEAERTRQWQAQAERRRQWEARRQAQRRARQQQQETQKKSRKVPE